LRYANDRRYANPLTPNPIPPHLRERKTLTCAKHKNPITVKLREAQIVKPLNVNR